MKLQLSKEAVREGPASRHSSLRRKRIAIIAGLVSSLITGWVLGTPQYIESSLKVHSIFDNGPERYSQQEHTYWTVVDAGWPLKYYVNNPNDKGVHIDYVALYADALFWILLTIGAGTGTGRLIWCLCWPPKFSLRSMFNWTVVIAVILGVVPVYQQLPKRTYSPLVSNIAFIALSFTIFSAMWTISSLASWLVMIWNRPPGVDSTPEQLSTPR